VCWLLVEGNKMVSTGIKWDNSAPYCGQLPAVEKIETGWCETVF